MATPGKGTPGWRKTLKSNNQQYFDVGKVGRKTGVTLKDTGVRDEHGMEPIAGIFSSPLKESPARGNKIISSSGMDLQESSAPEVDQTLHLRKTPRLPPPRASTPKHTNIGSPKRASSARPQSRANNEPFDGESSPVQTRTQPPPNRMLDFGDHAAEPSKVHTSIEEASPFKPKKSLRRSNGPIRRDLFASPEKQTSDALPAFSDIRTEVMEQDEPLSVERPGNSGGLAFDDYQPMPLLEEDAEDDGGATSADEVPATPSKQSPDRSRLPIANLSSGSQRQSPVSAARTASAHRKRDRSSLEREEAADSGVSLTEQPHKKTRTSLGKGKAVAHDDDDGSQVIDPTLAAQDDGYLATIPEDDDVELEQTQTKKKGKGGRPRKAAPIKPSHRQTSVPVNGSPSKLRQSPSKRGSSAGPVSNVILRSTTPFEDAGQRVSRYGRAVIQPLKHWANEHMIYKHGEIEGIVRADEVQKMPKKTKRRTKKKSRKTTNASRLDDADDDDAASEAESVLPDEWEEELGVISGEVPAWDAMAQQTDQDRLTKEDIAFASSSIVTKEVSGSEFRYAKILTLPFFGSGMVELPPEGFKRAKNSRKMQMVFFVHEGKCLVDVGGNEFAVSKGGVWVVPRGNNYAITNESRTTTAKVFFAQGCEVEALAG